MKYNKKVTPCNEISLDAAPPDLIRCSYRNEIAVHDDETITFARHKLHCMWSHTMLRLQQYLTRIKEGKDVMAASEFARFVRNVGLVDLFSVNATDGPLMVSGAKVDALCSAVLQGCADAWNNRSAPTVELAAVERINHKLDVIAAHLARVSSPPLTEPTANAGNASEPVLRVLQGGV